MGTESLAAYQAEPASRRLGRRGWIARRMLLGADVVGLMLAFVIATHLLAPVGPDPVSTVAERLLFVATLPLWAILAKLHGLYDSDEERADHSTADDLIGVFRVVTIGTFMVILAGWLSGRFDPTPPKLFTFWALAIVLMTAGRGSARTLLRRLPTYVQRTVVIGAGDVGQRFAEKILEHPEYGLQLIGFVDDRPREQHPGVEHVTILGGSDRLEQIVHENRVDRAIIAFSNDDHEVSLQLLRTLHDLDIRIDVVPRLFEAAGPNVRMHTVEGLPLAQLPRLRLSRSATLTKRAFDLVLTTLALVVLSPLLLLIAIAIKLDSPGPVLFRQTRIGGGGKPFQILKFRTMAADADERKHEVAGLNEHARNGDARLFKIGADPRATRTGAVLRRHELDELPQLVNVLLGQMSLVGPRPLILEEDKHLVDWRRRRHSVKPGMTGLWQVLGDGVPFEEMAILDYRYITGWTLLRDIQLLLRTLPLVMGPGRVWRAIRETGPDWVLGVRFAVTNLERAADAVVARARSGAGGFACLCNVHVLITAQRDEHLRTALENAWEVFADGAPVAWLQRKLGAADARRVAGPDLMPLVLERGCEAGLRHFLFGSTEDVNATLYQNLVERFPGARFVGSFSPGFGGNHDDAVARIKEARPDVVWCALGAPTQELWMHRNASALSPAVVLGVGAAFDFLAGTKSRAPSWMQNHGLEWLHRLATEPRRLASRYLITNSRFIVKTVGELSRRHVS